MRLACLTALAAVLLLGSCDRHKWETEDKDQDGQISTSERGTKELYEHHEEHEKHEKPGAHHEGGEHKSEGAH